MEIVRDKALIPLTPAADHSEKAGYFCEIDSSGEAAVVSAADTLPLGVIVEGQDTDGLDTVACHNFGGTVPVKLEGAVSAGDRLELTADGDVIEDSGSGARVIVGQALEDGAATELIEAALISPIALS
jgi:hypothetical protein